MQKTRSDSTKPSWRTTRTSLVTFVKTGDLKEGNLRQANPGGKNVFSGCTDCHISPAIWN